MLMASDLVGLRRQRCLANMLSSILNVFTWSHELSPPRPKVDSWFLFSFTWVGPLSRMQSKWRGAGCEILPPTHPTLSIKTLLFVINLCAMEAPDLQCAPNILDSFLIPEDPLLIPRLRSQNFHLICWDLFAVFGFALLRSDFLCTFFSLNCTQNKRCRLWHGKIYLFRHAHPADTSTDCTTHPCYESLTGLKNC